MRADRMIQKKVDSVMAFRAVTATDDRTRLAGEVLVYCSGNYRKVADICQEISLLARAEANGDEARFRIVFFSRAKAVMEALPSGSERSALITWLENRAPDQGDFKAMSQPKEIRQSMFDHVARIAARERCLLRQEEGWIVVLNGCLMMSCVLEGEEYRYYRHF